MNKNLIIVLIWTGIIIAITPALTFAILSEKVVVGEQLCVDGNNNINLAGIMCEDTESIVKGVQPKIAKTIVIVTGVLGLFIYVVSLFAYHAKSEVEDKNAKK